MEEIETIVQSIKPSEPPQVENPPPWEKMRKNGYPMRCINFIKDGGKLVGKGADVARRLWRQHVSVGDCILLLTGKPGTGKTLMATLWAYSRHEKGKSLGYYRKTVDLLKELTDTFDDPTAQKGLMTRYKETEYLVLDEFAVSGNAWKNETLTNLLDHRYDNQLTTIIISNMSKKEAESQLNATWLDRISHTGQIVDCNWDSYRKKI